MMASPSIRGGMASRRGETTQLQMASRFGKRQQVSRHRKCRPMRRSIRPKLPVSLALVRMIVRRLPRWESRKEVE